MMRTAQQPPTRPRSYYINTTLPAEKLDELQQCIDTCELGES
ncbi:MAG: hypothetical protein U0703_05630 [Anaerolineae bacterium]